MLAFANPMFSFIEEAIGKGESVLVHCLAGAHRAGIVDRTYDTRGPHAHQSDLLFTHPSIIPSICCTFLLYLSGTTGCACLIHFAGMDVDTAIRTAKRCRPIIDPIGQVHS